MKNLLLLIAILFGLTAKAQKGNVNPFDSLLCKEWKLASYEEGGKKYPSMPEHENDRMIFYLDHKVKSMESGIIQNGVWQYDPVKRELIVVDNETKEKAILKLLKMTFNECILEYKDPEGIIIKMNMVPVLK